MDDAGPDCVRLLDDQTFETLDRFGLEANEVCCAIASMSFSDDPSPYYVAGTAIVIAEEPEPTKVPSCHHHNSNQSVSFGYSEQLAAYHCLHATFPLVAAFE